MRRNHVCHAALMTTLVAGWATLAAAQAQQPGQQDRDLIRVRTERPEEPWLRINAGGHTGAVRALAFLPDSTRLCSAGLDKNVEVWNLKTVFRDLRRVFLRERTIRWQVARGPRGVIYALDAAPNDGLLAIGGYGAMGMLGEILLVDPMTGELIKVLDGHRQTIAGLSFSADGNWLASIDVAGQAMLWKREGWEPIIVDQPDRKTYGPEKASLIERRYRRRPIAVAGNRCLLLPQFAGVASDTRLLWRLCRVELSDPTKRRTLDTVHDWMVSALATDAAGRWAASADLGGNLYLWDLSRDAAAVRLQPGAVVSSLCFSPDGRTLVVGTAVASGQTESQLQIWDVAASPPEKIRHRSLPDHVYACAVSPDGNTLAYCGGRDYEVFVEPLDDPGKSVPLRGKGTRILHVAFAKREPFYRVAFGTGHRYRGFNDYAELETAFDPVRLELAGGDPPQAPDWLTAGAFQGNWRAKRDGANKLQLYRDDEPKGVITLDPIVEGTAWCYCWIPDQQGKPFAIAVGTDIQNSIYVYRLVEEGPCPILRHFRGHHDYVASVGVSADRRYLVSGSADGTVRFWTLAAYDADSALLRRWGAEFAPQQGKLLVTALEEAGPLFRKGIRKGDVLEEIEWHDGQQVRTERRAPAMLRQLAQLPWRTPLVFRTSRNGVVRPAFQHLPAWEPLATLFVGTDREWAFWTPEGYYDASVNGHTLFGWQVNPELDELADKLPEELPAFYRADQFRKTLERPDVMERLLPAGSLEAALREAAAQPPVETHQVLPKQIAATPRVQILSPRSGTVIQGNSTRVTARISTPQVSNLVRAKVFANGVVATKQELIQERDLPDGKEVTYSWDVPLPADERNLIQLLVATDAPTAAFSKVVVEREQAGPPAARPPKLYLLAVGINEYRDSEIPRLSYSVADAEAVAEQIRSRSKGLYDLDEVAMLTNRDVTPDRWQEALRQLAEKLREITTPDDLLVLFLAGHGIVGPETEQYYFLGYDFQIADLDSGRYAECISWDDFQVLADVPCRKLALLDTCHSGAIQPLRSYNLKAAIRALQEDVIFTVTASAGHEKAAENKTWGHGVFTKCLLEALAGGADQSRDGLITLDEVVSYVSQAVAKETDQRQHPTAGPEEILPFVTLPLTRAPEDKSSSPPKPGAGGRAARGRVDEGA